jgi:hypothetical protein
MNPAVLLATLALIGTSGFAVYVAAVHAARIQAHSRNARDRLAARLYESDNR